MYGNSFQTNPEASIVCLQCKYTVWECVRAQFRHEASWQPEWEVSLKVATLCYSLACLSKENVTSRLRTVIDNRQGRARQHYKRCHASFIYSCFYLFQKREGNITSSHVLYGSQWSKCVDSCPPGCTNKCPSSWPWTCSSISVCLSACLDEPGPLAFTAARSRSRHVKCVQGQAYPCSALSVLLSPLLYEASPSQHAELSHTHMPCKETGLCWWDFSFWPSFVWLNTECCLLCLSANVLGEEVYGRGMRSLSADRQFPL